MQMGSSWDGYIPSIPALPKNLVMKMTPYGMDRSHPIPTLPKDPVMELDPHGMDTSPPSQPFMRTQ